MDNLRESLDSTTREASSVREALAEAKAGVSITKEALQQAQVPRVGLGVYTFPVRPASASLSFGAGTNGITRFVVVFYFRRDFGQAPSHPKMSNVVHSSAL